MFIYLLSGPLISVCDPVMGDEGKLYVPPELVSVYRDKVSFQYFYLQLTLVVRIANKT